MSSERMSVRLGRGEGDGWLGDCHWFAEWRFIATEL
jgi:hypothetical protein